MIGLRLAWLATPANARRWSSLRSCRSSGSIPTNAEASRSDAEALRKGSHTLPYATFTCVEDHVVTQLAAFEIDETFAFSIGLERSVHAPFLLIYI
jgi:hypothetical protein